MHKPSLAGLARIFKETVHAECLAQRRGQKGQQGDPKGPWLVRGSVPSVKWDHAPWAIPTFQTRRKPCGWGEGVPP